LQRFQFLATGELEVGEDKASRHSNLLRTSLRGVTQ
jgi:hypothetical protein